ncbi:hypothetical protein QWZ10_07745 [Paracoccus cavernae]|uniref:Integrase catalytic domain-containing protein n=1 Tax=Paracoccus cavernae TaxID=1571207 RepID=A0ABT8D4P2_9RHOB|nr:hypothetical protein [Paracoccus cavernae]
MTLRLRLSRSDLLNIDSVPYRPLETEGDIVILERADQPGITQAFTHAKVSELLRSSSARYQPGYFDFARSRMLRDSPVELINELAPKVQSSLLWKSAICKAFLKLADEKRAVRTYASVSKVKGELELIVREQEYKAPGTGKRAGSEIISRKMPCSKTILKWVKRYEQSGYSALALLPKTRCSGNRDARWCHRTEAMASDVIEVFANTQRPSKKQAVTQVQRRIKTENGRRLGDGLPLLTIPSSRTLHRRLKEADPYYIHARRWGIDAANRRFNLSEIGVETLFPGERVEMDENRLDVITLLTLSGMLDQLPIEQVERLKVRRWIYAAKDCATKCIVAMRLATTPNAQDAVQTLRDVLQDRTPYASAAGCESAWDQVSGIGAIVTDQGSAFISAEFRSAAESLGVTMHLPPAGLPQMRGNMESFFRTLGHKLMPLLSGRTFFNPVERRDYPSEQLACLDDDDLIRILLTFVVDIYHNEPHGSLKGKLLRIAGSGWPKNKDCCQFQMA